MTGGSGRAFYPLNETYLGRWLSLSRIQSTPVTVLPLCLGYIMVSESIIMADVISLAIVGSLGHWGVYAMNDILDYSEDVFNKEDDKPLVSGEITIKQASIFVILFTSLSILLAYNIFTVRAFISYCLAVFMGVIYNWRCKDDSFSAIYLGVWGFLIVQTGMWQTGHNGISGVLMGVAFGSHMILMTIEGDLKDFHSDEPTIPGLMGTKMIVKDSTEYLKPNDETQAIFKILELIEIVSVLSILFFNDASPMIYIPTLAIVGIMMVVSTEITKYQLYNPAVLKMKIAIYTFLTAILFLITAYIFIGLIEVVALIIVTGVWGFGWQKLQYGSALYFP